MSDPLRLPNISGANSTEKIEGLKSYLSQTVSHLNRILSGLRTAPAAQEESQSMFSRLLPHILSSGEIARVLGKKLEKRFISTEKVSFYSKTANDSGTIILKSRFSTFLENGTRRQVFFLAGTLGGETATETLVVFENGTYKHENRYVSQVLDGGRIQLAAQPGDTVLVFTHLED